MCITAVVVPGNELGDVGAVGERFLDNKCIEGSIPEMLDDALVHRDYSIHTEGMPIQILMFDDRMEIHNPGGIYGRLKIDQLGKMQPDTRNPVLAAALEVLGVTENRHSNDPKGESRKTVSMVQDNSAYLYDLLAFCKIPRTRKEICDHLGLSSISYTMQVYIMPLVEQGLIKLTIPDKPRSPRQLYYS